MYQHASPQNEAFGDFQVYLIGVDGERRLLGEAQGHVEGGTPGWKWFHMGEVESHGSPVALELVAENVDNLPYAEVNLDRLMFMNVRDRSGAEPAPFWSQEVTLGALEEQVIEVTGNREVGAGKDIYIEFLDSEYSVFRNLSFDGRPSAAGPSSVAPEGGRR